jgi:hypothetical protein
MARGAQRRPNLEHRLCQMACNGELDVREAQKEIADVGWNPIAVAFTRGAQRNDGVDGLISIARSGREAPLRSSASSRASGANLTLGARRSADQTAGIDPSALQRQSVVIEQGQACSLLKRGSHCVANWDAIERAWLPGEHPSAAC